MKDSSKYLATSSSCFQAPSTCFQKLLVFKRLATCFQTASHKPLDTCFQTLKPLATCFQTLYTCFQTASYLLRSPASYLLHSPANLLRSPTSYLLQTASYLLLLAFNRQLLLAFKPLDIPTALFAFNLLYRYFLSLLATTPSFTALPYRRAAEIAVPLLVMKRSRMRQILHTFRVNRNLQDTCPVYEASGTSETNARPMLDQCLNNGGLRYRSRFAVLELSRPN